MTPLRSRALRAVRTQLRHPVFKQLTRLLLDRSPRLQARLRTLLLGARPLPRLQPHAPRDVADLSPDTAAAYQALRQAFDTRRS